MGKRLFFLFSILAFLSFVCSPTVSPTVAQTLAGRIVRVSDGDTVWIRLDHGNRVKVRIWGIDTPEKFKSKKLFREAKRCGVDPAVIVRLGKLASKQAKELLDHSKIKLVPKGHGYYGRLLGVIILPDGRDFGQEMVEFGFACTYRNNPEYEPAEQKAKRKRVGLWGTDFELMECLCR